MLKNEPMHPYWEKLVIRMMISTLVVLRNSRRFVAEQFRILRSNLKYMTVKKDNPSILVTSSFSGEGKSFISINMASVLALSGKKTVIMEFDIRKPKVMESLNMKRKMGITNYIIGRAQIQGYYHAGSGI